MKRILIIVFVLLSPEIISARSDSDTIPKRYNEALCYLQGVYKPYHPARAFSMFLELANEGIPVAMNAVGMMLAEGIGINPNHEQAYSWYEQAAGAGYYRAYYNMGIFRKYGYGVERNDTRALEYYTEGAGHGDPDCQYAVGYMLYKGIACRQNYAQALEMFYDAAASGNNAASYMIGLCYRNGYGVEKDEAEGRRWLEKSKKDGYYRAASELSSIEPENHLSYETIKDEILNGTTLPETWTRVDQGFNVHDISGRYSGHIVTYDWSGRYIVGLTSLNLDLQYNGNIITGSWKESDNNFADITASVTDTGLVFVNTYYNRTDHYRKIPFRFDFRSGRLQINKTDTVVSLTGNIELFSEVTMEPERPIYISLIRKETKIPEIPADNEKPVYDLKAFPNPFVDEISISFNLKHESETGVMIFSLEGRKLYQADFGRLDAGANIRKLKLNVTNGIYVISVYTGSASAITLIVR